MCFLGNNSMHWFRKDLRLHDNPALLEAIKGSRTFYGVYFLHPDAAEKSHMAANRWNFLLQCLHDLDASFTKCGGRLFVIRGKPIHKFPSLFRDLNIARLSFEADTEPFGVVRDTVISRLAKEAGIKVIMKTSHTLYNLDSILQANGGSAPLLFEDFERVVSKLGSPDMPVRRVDKGVLGSCIIPVSANHNEVFGVPTLKELGLKEADVTCSGLWTGGEKEALKRLEMALDEVWKTTTVVS